MLSNCANRVISSAFRDTSLSVSGARFIHSAGSANGATTNSLDPDHDDYYEYLDESFKEA